MSPRAYRIDPAEPGAGVRYEVWDGSTLTDSGEIRLSTSSSSPGWVAMSTAKGHARGRAESIPALLEQLEGAPVPIPLAPPAPPHAPTTAREAAHA